MDAMTNLTFCEPVFSRPLSFHGKRYRIQFFTSIQSYPEIGLLQPGSSDKCH